MTRKEFVHKLTFEIYAKNADRVKAALVGDVSRLADELHAVEPFDEPSKTTGEIVEDLLGGPLGTIIAMAHSPAPTMPVASVAPDGWRVPNPEVPEEPATP